MLFLTNNIVFNFDFHSILDEGSVLQFWGCNEGFDPRRYEITPPEIIRELEDRSQDVGFAVDGKQQHENTTSTTSTRPTRS